MGLPWLRCHFPFDHQSVQQKAMFRFICSVPFLNLPRGTDTCHLGPVWGTEHAEAGQTSAWPTALALLGPVTHP